MFIHIGGDTAIRVKDIIGIFDINCKDISNSTKEFLNITKEEGFVRKITDFKTKSFILTEHNENIVVYMSPISSVTLLKRVGFIEDANQMI
ncbi:MAG: DUF370 domain-containing protein [Clostridia bacterium]|nr:DUF370 domain-containing protein [Clostridia bacterium]